MNDRLSMVCGFLGGTIIAVAGGYKVFPHPQTDKIYNRLSDAKWFLALNWCDRLNTPAAIINNTGELAFINQLVLEMGEDNFIPRQYRQEVFSLCLPLLPHEKVSYLIPNRDLPNAVRQLEIQALLIDARYGKVALVKVEK